MKRLADSPAELEDSSPNRADINLKRVNNGVNNGVQTHNSTENAVYTKYQLYNMLSNMMYAFTVKNKLENNPNSIKLINIFNYMRNLIPAVVVFGAQSSGKSSTLNRMYKINNFTGCGTGTVCPIEIHNKSTVEFNSIELWKGDTILQKIENTSIENIKDFEVNLKRHNDNQLISDIDVKIVYNQKSNEDNIIIDLPGVIDTNNTLDNIKEYMDAIKQKYLNNEHTIIINVVRGDVDMMIDISRKHIETCANQKIIIAMTHVDTWLYDDNKINVLNQYIKTNPYKIALIMNRNDEEERLEKLIRSGKLKNSEQYIIGSAKLREFVSAEIKNKFNELELKIKTSLLEIKNILDCTFQQIGGRTPPDMRDVCTQYTAMMVKKIEDINNDVDINKNLIMNNATIKADVINDLINNIPDINNIANELLYSDYSGIEGSTGWNYILKKYLKVLAENSKGIYTDYIKNYINIYVSALINTVNKEKNNLNTGAGDYLATYLQNKIIASINEVQNLAMTKLDNLSMNPTITDSKQLENINRTRDSVIIKCVFEKLYHVRNRAEYIEEVNKKLDEFIDGILANISVTQKTNIYKENAIMATEHLKKLWKSLTENMYGTLYAEVKQKNKDILDELKHEIYKLTEKYFNDDVTGPVRSDLNNIYNIIDKLL